MVKISTFPLRAFKTDFKNPIHQFIEIKEVTNEEHMVQLQQTMAWSPQIFNGYRDKKNFVSSELLVLDIDDGNVQEFINLVKEHGHKCIITFTTSHLKNGNKDRFRATFYVSQITDVNKYKVYLKQLEIMYKDVGAEQGADPVKTYWKSEGSIEYYILQGKNFETNDTVPKKTQDDFTETFKPFQENIAIVQQYLLMSESELEGQRNKVINKLAFIMASRGHDQSSIEKVIRSKRLSRPLDEEYFTSVLPSSVASGKINYEKNKIDFGINKKKRIDPHAFFEEFKVLHDMQCQPNGMIMFDNKPLSDDLVIDILNVEAHPHNIKVNISFFKSLLNVWKMEEIENQIKEIEHSIRFVEGNDELRKFVIAISGTYDPLHIAVLTHWIWQVKRKFLKKDIKHHLMPVLYGRSRSGKSTAISKLLEPIKHLSKLGELDELNDTRKDFNLVEKLIIFFDELSKADKVSVASLKQKITSTDITYRRLGTNQNIVGYNMCSFIGTCNESIVDTIIDPTSSRRFYELKTLDQCDWKEINSIDYNKIWTGVDENLELAPIEPYLINLATSQEKIRAKDFIEEFIEEYKLKPYDNSSTKFIGTRYLYDMYKDWLEYQNKGHYLFSLAKFSRRLKDYDILKGRTSTQAGFHINQDALISDKNVISSEQILRGEQ